jgi:hypothetical protein
MSCLVVVLLGGCSAKPPLAVVEGTLTWNGAPLPGIAIQFVPDGDKGSTGPRSTAISEDNGHFILICDDNRPGAVIGHHRIVLMDSGNPNDGARQRDPRQRPNGNSVEEPAKPGKSPAIPNIYQSAITTPIKREVVPGKQAIELNLP